MQKDTATVSIQHEEPKADEVLLLKEGAQEGSRPFRVCFLDSAILLAPLRGTQQIVRY